MRSLSLCSVLCLQLFLFLSLSYYSFAFPSCHPKQSSALLDFKNSLFSFTSDDICAGFDVPLSTWRNGTNCCLWNGVTCNPLGHVIGLDLFCAPLHGKLLPNSSLFQLTYLQELELDFIDFQGSQIPPNISQLVSLTHLSLTFCNFSGEVPSQISHLHKLVSLLINEDLNNLILKEKTWERLKRNVTHINDLDLYGVDMSSIPSGHLFKNLSSSLVFLELTEAGLQGNLDENIFSFPHLQIIDLSSNSDLTGYLPKSNWSNSISTLNLDHTSLTGKLPHSIGHMKSLNSLLLTSCQFFGEIPPSLWNLTQLDHLGLSNNNFSGQISSSLSNLQDLSFLQLSSNNFSGQFPYSISDLKHLVILDLSNNKLHGPIPRSIFQLQNLTYLNFSHNCLTENVLWHNLSWENMHVLDLSSNSLQGELLPSICNASKLYILNLSHNNFTGTIPNCIVSSNLTLSVLDIQNNSFSGIVPKSFEVGNNLITLNLNGNFLEGSLPRSLINCMRLRVLDLGNNNIEDVFPHWLDALEKLQVLVVRGNKLHGFIPSFKGSSSHAFHMLRVLDLSSNNLKGPLPASFFKSFKGIRRLDGKTRLQYLNYEKPTFYGGFDYEDSIEVTLKGFEIYLQKILTVFTSIDLSNNMFEGEIPQVIGEFNALKGLNFSHNRLTGAIPISIGNLRNLEWLDLSSNNFTGRIPTELTNLNFLEVLNLSKNELEGCIPRGQQFETFSSDSFNGNKDLRGFQLMLPCNAHEERQEPLQSSGDGFEFGWKPVVLGYVCGAAFGAILFQVMMFTGKPQWVVSLVNDSPKKRKRRVRNRT